MAQAEERNVIPGVSTVGMCDLSKVIYLTGIAKCRMRHNTNITLIN